MKKQLTYCAMVLGPYLVGAVIQPAAAVSCDGDTCTASHSSLFAIAHDHNDYSDTILYRVTPPEQATGTHWGDGSNGFFYRYTNDLGQSYRSIVPFNGVGVSADGAPTLRPFSFIIKAPTTATQISVQACASNYASDSSGAAECGKLLWTDTYATLPSPSVGAPSGFPTTLTLEYLNNSVSVRNNGVYGARVLLEPSASLTEAQIDWLYDHLVFLDGQNNVYTNDVLADSTTSPSFAALPIEQAAHPTTPGGSAYTAKYGKVSQAVAPNDPSQTPNRWFWVYSSNVSYVGSGQSIPVSVGWLYDASVDCPGALSGDDNSKDTDCGGAPPAAALGSSNATLDLTVLDGSDLQAQAQADFEAGQRHMRTVTLSVADTAGLCSAALNPLAVWDTTANAVNLPNYVIGERLATGSWQGSFPSALYYVLPTGFGNCAGSAAPFCERTPDYAAYVPHYLTANGQGGERNGGSTAEPVVGSLALADQYSLTPLTDSQNNSLVWFDNCGYGHLYSDTALSARKTLPVPPHSRSVFSWELNNDADQALVLTKHCCASWYQQNTASCSQDASGNLIDCEYDPPQQIGADFGLFLGKGAGVAYETLFGNESFRVYSAGGGQELFGFTAGSKADPQLHICPAADATLSVDQATQPRQLHLFTGSGGAVHCNTQLVCPPGTPANAIVFGSTPFVACTATESDFMLDTDLWADQDMLSQTAGVVLAGWGGAGHKGADGKGAGSGYGYDGGSGGTNGFALTVLRPSDLPAALFAYVGGAPSGNSQGGASTIVARQPLTTAPQSAWSNPARLNAGDVYLIAGGGGGGGYGSGSDSDQFDAQHTGGNGGGGGVALANAATLPGSAVSGAGAEGHDHGDDEGGGQGGSDGKGGSGHVAGHAGIGGFGAPNQAWVAQGSLVPVAGWTPGSGGNYQGSASGGNGGGGYGGGGNGGGAGKDQTWGHGGGGGGSWAAGNTAHLASVPTSFTASPAGDPGAAVLSYPGCHSPVCLEKGKMKPVSGGNGNNCVNKGAGKLLESGRSSLSFSADGDLVLANANGEQLWHSNTANKGVKLCFWADAADLSIHDANGDIVWGSGSTGVYLIIHACTVQMIDADGKATWTEDYDDSCG